MVLDALRDHELPTDLEAFARFVTDRHRGVGSDGLVVLDRGERAPFRMRMFNPDGSESEMCGNAIRCIHRLAREHGHTSLDSFDVETGAGTQTVSGATEGVRVSMGAAKLKRSEIPMEGRGESTFIEQPIGGFAGTAVSMGNPHLVVFVDDAAAVDLLGVGPKLERDPLFPNRTNVHFAQVIDRTHLIQRTWERGAGPTLACGTGACAVAVAGFETGRTDRSVDVKLPGGHLQIDYADGGEVFMTGPAEIVFEGEIELAS